MRHHNIQIVATLVIILFSITSCCPLRTTSKQITDTIYVEHIIEKERIVRDTIRTTNNVIEYVVDSVGVWQPQKKVVTETLQTAVAQIEEEHTAVETIREQSKIEVEEQPQKKPHFVWLLLGIVLGLLLITILLRR